MIASPYDREVPPPLSGDSSLSEVIQEFLRATDPGAERRELRAALSHVNAERGSMAVRAVRARHYTALLDELRLAGISPERELAVIEALHSLYAFAVARGLVAVDPLGERASPSREPPPRQAAPAPTGTPKATPGPTPTLTMLAFGARVAFWTTWIIMLVFFGLLFVLVVELA